MKQLAEKICQILFDYHNHLGFKFTYEHVINWVVQFDEVDQQFILEEFLHLLNQGIYISEEKGRRLLISRITELSNFYGFKSQVDFLNNVEFLKLQPDNKSQFFLLTLMEEELKTVFGLGLKECGKQSKKYAIYLDDILATGGTVFESCKEWLKFKSLDGTTNLMKVLSKEKILIISLFCNHTWANVDWRLKVEFDTDAILYKIVYAWEYEIQNHPTKLGQKLNLAYPNSEQPQTVLDYFEGLPAKYNGEYAFRKHTKPSKEEFFSSSTNRTRFENILLKKGVELLQNTVSLSRNHRPLGATTPSKKTLGTGTLFFTWRNISNTTPIVFWWGAHWYPLFPLSGRGN